MLATPDTGRADLPLAPLAALWLLVSVLLIWSGWTEIVTLSGWDPDDQLRLAQLRDFVSGQSWFDTNQYRMNPPDGAPMHWSRMVELPLALLVLVFRPLFGQPIAEMIAGTAVPLLLLGWIAFMLAKIAARISSREAGVVAALITLSSGALLMQLRPMRIDHHGWQIAMAVLALSTIFWPDNRKAGRVLGLALAVWLHISLEGAPMTAAFFLLLGVRWILDAEQAQRLFWTVISFAAFTLLIFLGTQSQGFFANTYCDTVSPPHILGILFALAVMVPAIFYLSADWRFRLAAAALAGIGAVLIIFNLAPQCLNGAFGNMDPLVREYWYSKVNEGLPVWHQEWRTAAVLTAGLFCGAISWCLLIHKLKDDDRGRLLTIGFFVLYGLLLSVAVIRTVSVASAYAIPVTAALIAVLFKRYRQSTVPLRRIGLVAAMLGLLVPGAAVSSLMRVMPSASEQTAQAATAANKACESATSVATLAKIPDAFFVAPFDMGPMILVQTPNKVLASSHHRNERAMRDHIQIFRSPPPASYRILKQHGISHLAACLSEAELGFYEKKDPNGFWAQIKKGNAPDWLQPMPDMGKGIKVWRVR
jgi:hypothetical protein